MNDKEVLFKEYETLRNEILTAMTARNSILSFGLATVGVLFTGAAAVFVVQQKAVLPALVLMLVAPIICIFVLFIWLGEYQRMHRAGRFIIRGGRQVYCASDDPEGCFPQVEERCLGGAF